jgi:hypothetical protein
MTQNIIIIVTSLLLLIFSLGVPLQPLAGTCYCPACVRADGATTSFRFPPACTTTKQI